MATYTRTNSNGTETVEITRVGPSEAREYRAVDGRVLGEAIVYSAENREELDAQLRGRHRWLTATGFSCTDH